MAAVELQKVGKAYGRNAPVVRDFDLAVEPGEFMVLVGPSGCGKSTLLRMIAGLEEVTAGNIRIDGRATDGIPAKDRDVAMVFQSYALYPHLTVFDNMAFALRMRRVPADEIRRKVEATASMLGLVPHLGRRPRELSGGERQRVALGRAMVREPKVFLFDEPLSNLDAKLRVQMRGEIKRLHQSTRATMIYVTHDQVEAMTLGDRIAVMNAGVLQQVADPFTIYRRPANRFVAEFLGTPPINLFRARVAEANFVLESNGVTLPLPEATYRRLAGEIGSTVDVGVRPEHIRLDPEAPGSLPAVVEVLEPLGSEVLVHWSTALGPLVSRIGDGQVPAVGERLALRFDWDATHFFNAETQRVVAAAG